MVKKVKKIVMAIMLLLCLILPYAAQTQEEILLTPEETVETSEIIEDLMEEEVAARTLTSKQFMKKDGSYTGLFYASPIHYQDEKGKWKDIDLHPRSMKDLSTYQAKKFGMRTSTIDLMRQHEVMEMSMDERGIAAHTEDFSHGIFENNFGVFFPKTIKKPICLSFDENNQVFFMPLEIETRQAKLHFANTESNEYIYDNLWESVSLHYSVNTTGIKEQILLKTSEAPTEYRFFLAFRGCYPRQMPEGGIEISNAGGVLGFISKPWAQDADGKEAPEMKTDLIPYKEGYILAISLDKDWLESKERVFPVEIDPSINCQPSHDTYINQQHGGSNFGKSSDLCLGNWHALHFLYWAYHPHRILIKFPIDIGQKIIVDSVDLKMYCTKTTKSGSRHQVKVYAAKRSWSETGATWNNASDNYDANRSLSSTTVGGCNFSGWSTFKLNSVGLETIKGWSISPTSNYGMMLMIPQWDGGPFRYYRSSEGGSNQPYLQVGFRTDTEGPTGSISINNGSKFTNTRSVTLTLSAKDNLSGVSGMCFRNESGAYSGWESYKTSKSWTLSANDSKKTVYVQYIDGLGNTSEYASSITFDTTPPTGSILINNGVSYTNTRSVTLTLSAKDNLSGVSEMRFKNESGAYSGWEPYKTSKSWTLSANEGTRQVYVQFKDAIGNISKNYSDTIIYDITPPTGSISIDTTDKNLIKVVNGRKYTKKYLVPLKLSATDNLSGVTVMQFSGDGRNFLQPQTFSQTGSWSWSDTEEDGPKKIYVKFRDGAGNSSVIYEDTVILDTKGPSGTITINNGNGYTNNSKVTLTLSADDGGGIGVTGMRFKNEGGGYSGWDNFQKTKTWELSSGADGDRTVSVLYQDAFGQVSEEAKAKVTLDRGVPSGSFKITSRDGTREFNQEKPANTVNVKINILSLYDCFGVKGVYLWNGTSVTPPGNAVYLPISGINVKKGIDWELDDKSIDQTVNIQVIDLAGNSSSYQYHLRLDTAPPPAPDQKSFSHTPRQFGAEEVHSTITFTWEANDPEEKIFSFTGSYLIAGAEREFATGDIRITKVGDNKVKGTAILDIHTLGYNQPVTIKIKSLDSVGGESGEKVYTAYTKARLGQIIYDDGGYDENTKTHYLKWRLTDNGKASKHIIEYGAVQEAGFAVDGRVEAGSDGTFILTGLRASQSLNCRLIALNGSHDRTEGSIFTETVPNTPPTPPEPLAPLKFTRSIVEFRFKEAIDYDGDHLLYRIYFAEGDDPHDDQFALLGSLTKSDINNGVVIRKEGLTHRKSYTWYVIADDNRPGGRTKSEKVIFTVDTVPPDLIVEEPKMPYSAQRQLSVAAKDDLSGIQKLLYRTIDPFDSKDIVVGEVTLTPDANGILSGVINLDEGHYHLHMTLYDQAGNQTTKNLNNLFIDNTPPQLLEYAVDLEKVGGRYITNSNRIPVHFIATDSLSLINGLWYQFVADEQPEEFLSFLPLSPYLEEYKQMLEFYGEDGREYYAAISVEDRAGNRSYPIEYLGPFYVDRTPPAINLSVEGYIPSGGRCFSSSLESLVVKAFASDDESGIKELQYAVAAADSKVAVSGWGDWSVIRNTLLDAGVHYRIAAQATNGVGLTTTALGQEFIYDNTLPEIISFTGPENEVASGEEVLFEVLAEDDQSGITQYRLALGTLEGATDLSKKIPGNRDGWLIISTRQIPAIYRVEIPEVNDGTYYATVMAQDAAGNEDSAKTEFTVKNVSEKIIVTDGGPYSSYADIMTGSWRYIGEKIIGEYRYRVVNKDNQPLTDWETTNATEGIVNDLDLLPGEIYRFEAQARFIQGDYSISGFSRGVLIDLSPPDLLEVETPAFTTSDNLWFRWKGVDPESGITQARAALGSDYLLTDLTEGWVELIGEEGLLNCDINGESLNLQTGVRYHLTLSLTNGAGLVTEVVAASIVIDDTPPPIPTVYDQGAYINDRQPLEANWIWTPEDPESGTTQYQWVLMAYGEKTEALVWHEVDDTKRITLTDFRQEHGKTYYFAVKAINGSGLFSIGWSDGIIVDATAPFLPKIILLDAINLKDPSAAEELNYITSAQELGLWIDSYDPDSGIAEYYYAWGTREEVDAKKRLESNSATIELKDPELEEDEITVFIGESINNAGAYSLTGYSIGVMLDTGTPEVGEVRGFYSGNRLFFDWDVVASRSPVVKYELSLLRGGAGEDSRIQTTSSGRGIVFDMTALEDGIYRLQVIAVNAAGTISEKGESRGILVDRTPPRITTLRYNKYISDEIQIIINGEDESGLNCYQYTLGTVTNQTQFSGGWRGVSLDDGSNEVEFAVDTKEIPHNTTVYLSAKARDNVGLWSAPLISEGILVDHTPPEKLEISCGSYTTSLAKITEIVFDAIDPESGITNYMMSVIEEGGDNCLTEPEPTPISEFNGALIGLNLTEGKRYLVVLSVQNAAGLWSEVAYSNPVTVDTIPPSLVFTAEGSEVVLNQPPLDIEYHLSEEAEVILTLTLLDGTSKKHIQQVNAGIHNFLFDENKPGTYMLYAKTKDRAGNIGEEKTLTIKVNAPPIIIMPTQIESTPGQPIRFNATAIDLDGEVVEYRWDPGDGSGLFYGSDPEYAYDFIGEYTLTLAVTDNDGATTTRTALITVKNTTAGRLYTDEVWQDEHWITGDVTVPEGISLTILPGTRVTIDGIPGVSGHKYALIVEGRLIIDGNGPEVSFSSALQAPSSWSGILLQGQAVLENVRVKHAIRGLTVIHSARAEVVNCIFLENQVGVHAYGSRPRIEKTRFERNTFCGVKEDEAGRPFVIDCLFAQNGIDYYHEELTALSIEQLNRIDGNSGNHK